VFSAAESEASVGDYGQCHYSHVADNSLPTYNEVVLQRTLGLYSTHAASTLQPGLKIGMAIEGRM